MKEKLVETTEEYVRVRVKNPDLFIDGSFRTIDISVDEGIKAIIGKLKSEPEGNTVVQAYLFDKEEWTEDEAVAWVEEHSKYALPSIIKLYEVIPISQEAPKKKMHKFFKAKTLSIDEENKSIWALATNDEVDRDKEINSKDSWKKRIDTFLKHPVLLSSHNYMSLQSQIGEIVDHKFTDNGLEMQVKYYAGEGNAEADWGWTLASKGMAMFSVGYIPHKIVEGDEIPKEYQDKGANRIFTDNELLELSQVVVGANRGALQLGFKPDTEQCQYMFEIVKSFGKDIPEFNPIYKEVPKQTAEEEAQAKADAEAKEEADKKAKEEAEGKEKIAKDSFILSPVEIKNMKDLDEIVAIWKSGRIISRKNQDILNQAKENLTRTIEIIDQLLALTEKPSSERGEETEEETDAEKMHNDLQKVIEEVKQLQNKIKS